MSGLESLYVGQAEGVPLYLEVVDHSDVGGRLLSFSIVHNRVSLRAGDAAGGKDLVVLVHAEGLPAKVFHRKGLTNYGG